MDKTFYPTFDNNWDDDRFRNELEGVLKGDFHCLDYGAGRGIVGQMNFRSCVAFVAGVDPDEVVFSNPYIHEAKLLPLPSGAIPYEDERFDVVYCANVMEHIEDPAVTFREIARVLKPGGLFIAKTPNKRHYVPLIARVTPTSFHRFYNALRGRKAYDTFETRYRCNTSGDVRRYQAPTELVLEEVKFWEGRPEYLRIFWLFYLFGLAYERIVNAVDHLAFFRSVMVIRLRKSKDWPATEAI